MNGTTEAKSISFSEVKYSVTFTESGLPSGTAWYVNLTNGMKSGAITKTSYSFSVTNGTYTYTLGNVTGYNSSVSSGSISVKGSGVSKTVTYNLITKASSAPSSSNTVVFAVVGVVAVVALVGAGMLFIRKKK